MPGLHSVDINPCIVILNSVLANVSRKAIRRIQGRVALMLIPRDRTSAALVDILYSFSRGLLIGVYECYFDIMLKMRT